MQHALLIKSRIAAAAIAPHTIAAANGVANGARLAVASSDRLLGVVDEMGATAAGQTVDVTLMGIADVRAGAAFADGDLLTTDGEGRAIVAAALIAAPVRVVGIALAAAVAAGDIVPMLVAPSVAGVVD